MIKPYFEDKGIVLYHSDCRAVLPEIPNESIDLTLTDPPFGNCLEYGRNQLGSRKISNDDNLDWLPEVSKALWEIQKNDTTLVWFCQWRTFADFWNAFVPLGFKMRTTAVWDKLQPGLSGGGYSEQWEAINVWRKGEPREQRNRGNVFGIPRVPGRPVHPNEKPLRLIISLMEMSSKEGDLVFDPFMGSGTTALAARSTGRRAICCELDEQYCEYAARQLQQQSLF